MSSGATSVRRRAMMGLPSRTTHRGSKHDVQPKSRLPIEVYEEVIDCIASRASFPEIDTSIAQDDADMPVSDQPQLSWRATLVACAFVCRVWRIRALFHLNRDVWLPSRKHVVSLSRHLRRHPDRQAPIEHVFIVKSSADHLSTFAMMLARQLPSLRSLTLVDVDFRTARSLHAGSIRHLSAYPNMTRLELRFVAFETASQFASLLLALPHLRYLACHTVFCLDDQRVMSSSRLPHKNQCEIVVFDSSDEIVDALATLSTILLARKLTYASPTRERHIQQGQQLLDAYGPSLCDVRIDVPELGIREKLDMGHTNLDICIDLSRQTSLMELYIDCPLSAAAEGPHYSSIAEILSSISSHTISQVHICFSYYKRPKVVNTCISNLKSHIMSRRDDLKCLDDALSSTAFANIPARGIRLELKMRPTEHFSIAVQERLEKFWKRVHLQRMPRLAALGILDCFLTIVGSPLTNSDEESDWPVLKIKTNPSVYALCSSVSYILDRD